MDGQGLRIVGRDAELTRVEASLVDPVGGIRAACLAGEPGIGKSSLWRSGCASAEARSWAVLAARPAESEARYSFSGLRDLFDTVADDVLAGLPAPQRDALATALLRTDAERVDHRALAAAALTALRRLAAVTPVCVAVDDLQWLDRPTARVLAFALRRLEGEPVRLLTSYRSSGPQGPVAEVVGAVDEARVASILVGPLDAGVLRELIRQRIDRRVGLPILTRIVEASRGNPLVALEVARSVSRGAPVPMAPLPAPEAMRELVGGRVVALPPAVRTGLRLAAAAYQPTLELLQRAGGRSLTAAVDAGLVEVDGRAVRFTHPLIASAVYEAMSPEQRRKTHAKLAAVASDVEEHARHLALAAEEPDQRAAAALEEAAAAAAGRGAPDAGGELAEMAARLTPPGADRDGRRRTITAADYHFDAGDGQRARTLLEPLLNEPLTGAERADVLQRLGAIAAVTEGMAASVALLEQALEAAGSDVRRSCTIEELLVHADVYRGEFTSAHRRSVRLLELTQTLDDPAATVAPMFDTAVMAFLLGHGLDRDLLDRAVALEDHVDAHIAERHPRVARALTALYADDTGTARNDGTYYLAKVREAGQYGQVSLITQMLTELELLTGNWKQADRYAAESVETAAQTGQDAVLAWALCSRAVVDAHLGRVTLARAAIHEAGSLAGPVPDPLMTVFSRGALGFLELSVGDAAAASEQLRTLPDIQERMGVREPAYFRFQPNAIEALIMLGDLDEAERSLHRFEAQARAVERVWALTTAARCHALLHAARGDLSAALAAADEALAYHERLDYPFELARTLLVKGTTQRRLKQKAAPRQTITQALDVFDRLGAALWAERARAELARTAPAPVGMTELSPTEDRVARLAAAGHTNREIAAKLSMSIKTVEANLGRIYRKLSIRSRTELARIMPPGSHAASRGRGDVHP